MALTALALLQERLATPLGPLLILSDHQQQLRGVDWLDHEARLRQLLARQYRQGGVTVTAVADSAPPSAACVALAAYFEGALTAIDALPLALGGTDFQRGVWTALRNIAPGQTLSYRELATRLGRPTAMRATGLANGANPISVVLPCHRVIGSDGSLTGYGGGLARKRWLLAHEERWSPTRWP